MRYYLTNKLDLDKLLEYLTKWINKVNMQTGVRRDAGLLTDSDAISASMKSILRLVEEC